MNECLKRKRVGLWPAALFHKRQGLWCALEQLFPLTFVPFGPDEAPRLDALVAITSDQTPAFPAAALRIPCFVCTQSPEQRDGSVAGAAVEFERHLAVPAVFRGRTLSDAHTSALPPLRVEAGDQLVASQQHRPVWIHHPPTQGAAARDVVSLPLPMLSEHAHLRDCFHGGNFLCALPLLAFLQRLTPLGRWQPAPQHACVVFDDPSLRWLSYGLINYQQLVRHAQRCNYHAAIGFVPLDAVWVNRSSAAIFRSSPDRLSLAMHGCNHLRLEMARTYSSVQRMAICAQALRRIEGMECRHSLTVCRVMESPFGVIDQAMFAPLLALGYEAALITTSQFLSHHQGVQFSPCFGLQAASHLSGGLGMIPRITIRPRWQTEARLAAFLGQPIVIAGHHRDAANELEALEEIAETVNGFGPVRWCSLTEIARANYATRLDGTTLSVSVGSRRILLPVPEGVHEVSIRRPWIADNAAEPLIVRDSDQTVRATQAASAESALIVVMGPTTIEICSPVSNPVDPHAVPAPRPRLWPYVRRALTEARDQASPLLSRRTTSPRPAWKVSPASIPRTG
jgi:hypothetical protein